MGTYASQHPRSRRLVSTAYLQTQAIARLLSGYDQFHPNTRYDTLTPMSSSYVLLASTFTLAIGTWHGLRIAAFRRAAGIPYPHVYAPTTLDNKSIAGAASTDSATDKDLAPKYYLFNCAQRSHHNFLENYTTFNLAMLIAGIRFPLTAAGMGVFWGVNRVVYAVGYTRPDKEKGSARRYGIGYYPAQLGCIALAAYTGIAVVLGW